MNLTDYWFPYVITHVVTVILIIVCYKWAKIGKVAWGIIFILAGIFNIFTVVRDPQVYLGYRDNAMDFYKFFIDGVFSSFTIFIVSLIGTGQILVGIFLLRKGKLFLLGILGGIIFLVAIAPLGIGSAFPSTLLMAISLGLLYIRYKKV
jgi:hypothetical protein